MGTAGAPRITVLDDDQDFLELMRAILHEDAGYDVSIVRGTTTVDQLAATRPDLLIVDLLLHGSSGWDVVKQARADERLATVPIILCSGDLPALRDRADELERIGDVHELAKPFGVDEITTLVGDLVGRGPAQSG